jgi:SAM-dependent methyltransferase
MSLTQTRSHAARSSARSAAASPKRCDLCEGTRFDLIGERDRRGEVLHTAICLQCGLVCHMAIPSEEKLAEFYARDYRREYHGEATPSPRRVMRAWKNAQRIYRQLVPHLRQSDCIFEVGAGIGCNVKLFEVHGHDASGIEPNVGFQRFSAEELRAQVHNADLFTLADGRRYDLVLLVHVIEHFRSPRAALERIHGLLRPGGRLYVECPNLAAPFARPGRLFHFAHVHNFTPATLRMLARRCGYEIEQAFSDDGDPNLQMLLRRSEGVESSPWNVEYGSEYARRTLAALHKHNAVTYHLRGRYLRDRAAKLVGYLKERLFAGPFVSRLIAQCRRSAGPPCAT